ncbi:cytochrome c3 family protein [bacterium]|nr:cytochrome c3 family protein [bacterium]
MRKLILLYAFMLAGVMGCSRAWVAPEITGVPPKNIPDPDRCGLCHQAEYNSWRKTVHATTPRIAAIPELPGGCAACHANVSSHIGNPDTVKPPHIPSLSGTDKNLICGKCHFNREIVGRKAINPRDRHGLFLSVGFESKAVQLDCLQCHRGHGGKSDMLRSMRANACFKCHKEAIITMGVFQPVNYLAAGKACFGCHTAHGGSAPGKLARMTVGIGVTCVICHPTLDLSKTGF